MAVHYKLGKSSILENFLLTELFTIEFGKVSDNLTIKLPDRFDVVHFRFEDPSKDEVSFKIKVKR